MKWPITRLIDYCVLLWKVVPFFFLVQVRYEHTSVCFSIEATLRFLSQLSRSLSVARDMLLWFWGLVDLFEIFWTVYLSNDTLWILGHKVYATRYHSKMRKKEGKGRFVPLQNFYWNKLYQHYIYFHLKVKGWMLYLSLELAVLNIQALFYIMFHTCDICNMTVLLLLHLPQMTFVSSKQWSALWFVNVVISNATFSQGRLIIHLSYHVLIIQLPVMVHQNNLFNNENSHQMWLSFIIYLYLISNATGIYINIYFLYKFLLKIAIVFILCR